MSSNHFDASAITKLFRQRNKNHKEICEFMYRLVSRLAKLPSLQSPGNNEDAIADATLHLIERIDRFTYAKGANAFSYYTSVAIHALRYCRTKNGKQHANKYISQFVDPNSPAEHGNNRDGQMSKTKRMR